jgi:hypothetical protein
MPKIRIFGFAIVAMATLAAYVRSRPRQKGASLGLPVDDDRLADIINRLSPAIERARLA